jgi:uncharacterized membrane protein
MASSVPGRVSDSSSGFYARSASRRERRGGSTRSPRADDLLTERFARGEIDDEELRRRMALLQEHR